MLRYFRRGQWGHWGLVHWLSVGLLVGGGLLFCVAPWPMMDKLRAIGFAMCPQRPAHSLFIDGTQLPLEARKIGLYLGFLVALFCLIVASHGRATRLPRPPVLGMLIAFVAIMGLDGFNALLYDLALPNLYVPNNMVRTATGQLSGLTLAALLLPTLSAALCPPNERCEEQGRPSLLGWKELARGLGVQFLLFLVVISGAPFLLYPLALLSIAGALTMLSSINALLLVGVIRRPSRAVSILGLLPIAAAALLISGAELLAMAAFRLSLVGTAPL